MSAFHDPFFPRIVPGSVLITIVEHRRNDSSQADAYILRVFRHRDGDVRAFIVPGDLSFYRAVKEEMSRPVAEALLDALALCEMQQVAMLTVHDPDGLFPRNSWPVGDV